MVSEREAPPRSCGHAKRKQRQDSEVAANCPICCGLFRQCVALIPCGHAFCKACVQAWLKQSPSCPTCRSSVEDGQWVRVRVVDEDKTTLLSLRNLLLLAKAAGPAEEISQASFAVFVRQTWAFALQPANEHLCRAEDLADAAGYKAAAALARASRGHLCGLAADALVQLAPKRGRSGSTLLELLAEDEVEVIQSLCDDDDFAEAADVMDIIGRLSDLAASETFAALNSLDPVVESDAAATLSLMASGAIQAAVGRLQTLPPPNLSSEECGRAQLDMLSQALQTLPGEGAGCPSLGGNARLEQQAEILAAQAHLAMTEVHLHLNGLPSGPHSGRQKPSKPSKPSKPQWSLEKGRSALHRAAVKVEHDPVVKLLLVHAHLLGAQVQGQETGPKKLEHSLEELISASRISVDLNQSQGGSVAIQAARESRALLLESVRTSLRALCTGKACNEGWKDLYRFALKLQASQLNELVLAYDERHLRNSRASDGG
eukprot:s1596_g5.t1